MTLALEQSADASIEPAVVELLTGALGDAVYLAGLTNNLRLASELREGWDPIAGAASVDLTETVQRVASRASILARRPGIALECSVPDIALRTECNAVAAEQAIGNVVDNAVLHGEPGGHIAVLLEPDGPAGHAGFALSVVDDGPGVPPTELPRLRERTFRSDEARQRDPRGSGLGLAITNEVCVRCGWDLAFSAEMPRGLRVRITGRCS